MALTVAKCCVLRCHNLDELLKTMRTRSKLFPFLAVLFHSTVPTLWHKVFVYIPFLLPLNFVPAKQDFLLVPLIRVKTDRHLTATRDGRELRVGPGVNSCNSCFIAFIENYFFQMTTQS